LLPLFGLQNFVASYAIDAMNADNPDRRYSTRPLAYVDQASAMIATARAMLNDQGEVVRVLHGLAPLWGTRRGEDVMLTNVLAFDVRVFDPGAPLYLHAESGTVLEPTDPGWRVAYQLDVPTVSDVINGTAEFPYVGQGAYVDLGYAAGALPDNWFPSGVPGVDPWFFRFQTLSDVYLPSRPNADTVFSQLAPGFAVYDTWSFHYENNGINEDALRYDGSSWEPVDTTIDEATNGLEDVGSYSDGYSSTTAILMNPRLGVDDIGERETAPPYDQALRGIQVLMRAYEPDSRQIRQVSVNQTFVPE
jgi:hypothetical protein